jgi:uncharacterized membrane protein YoaK (UPF0700 family)
MTGTTVQLGHALVQGNRTMAAVVVTGFLLGSIVGRAVIEAGARRRVQRIGSVTIAMEGALVLGFIAFFSRSSQPTPSFWSLCVLLIMLAAAMGLQTATLTRIGPLTVHTTFVTGMLNKLAQLVSHILFHTYDLIRAEAAARQKLRNARKAKVLQACFFASIWLMYLAGAVVGTWSFSTWGIRAIYLSALLLLPIIIIDQFQPFSLQEERDQSEL